MQYGHFDNEKREYVIDRVDLPVSWTNYLGVNDMCAVVNHTAGGYIFYQSPEYHRITRFRGNGVPMDRPGHYVYLRDDESGDYWSISWQPVENCWIRQNIPADTVCPIPYMNVSTAESRLLRLFLLPWMILWRSGI